MAVDTLLGNAKNKQNAKTFGFLYQNNFIRFMPPNYEQKMDICVLLSDHFC